MKKRRKGTRYRRIVLSGIILLALIIGVFAPTSTVEARLNPASGLVSNHSKIDLSKDTYKKLVSDEILGDDVTYEDWKSLVLSSVELEKKISSGEFYEVYSSQKSVRGSSFLPEKGDIVITNGTSSAGFLGHAGIAISPYSILHIEGPGYSPTSFTFGSWNNKYSYKSDISWTKVYRHTNSSVASAAADWAWNTYGYSNAKYKITIDLTSTSETYCSKIVWQAYYYGPPSPQVYDITWGFRLPYDLPYNIYNLSLANTYSL